MHDHRLLGPLVLAAALAAAAAGCGGGGGGEGGGGGGESDAVRAAIVTDVGGLGDQSFNDSANAGLVRAAEELGAKTNVLESGSPTDYDSNLTKLADNGFSPVFAVGFLMTDSVTNLAPQYPDTNFAIIDSVVEADNVASLTFREGEGGYLAGVVAGLMTQEDTDYTTSEENVVGFLGGQEGAPPVQKFQAGYEAGVEAVCADCEVISQYVGATLDAFNDPARGREISLQQIDGGADVIFHGAGASGAGLFEAATDGKIFAIGVDSDQAKIDTKSPILTSALKRVDNAVFQTTEQAQNGEFPGGQVVELGLAEDGLALASFGRFDDQVPQAVKDQIKEARQGIIDGEITIPEAPQ